MLQIVGKKPPVEKIQLIATTTTSSLATPSNLAQNSSTTVPVIVSTTSEASTTVNLGQKATTSAEKPNVSALSQKTIVPKMDIPKDWGMVSVELGFSLRYPYKEIGASWGDDEYFQVGFLFPPSIVSNDASTTEKIGGDIHNINLYAGMMVTLIEYKATSTDLKTWSENYLKKEDGSYGNKEIAVLSEETEPIIFAGQKGYLFTRQIEGSKYQNSPHYMKKEIFIRKDKFVYRFSYLDTSKDTVFPRSGVAGKKYLERVGVLSREVLSTFAFDGTKTTSITVPKTIPKQPTGEAGIRREKLLVALRNPPYFDEKVTYEQISGDGPCAASSTPQETNSVTGQRMSSSYGIFIAAGDGVFNEKNVVEIHAYDENGNHTGPMPPVPWGSDFLNPVEERARGIGWINLGSIGYGLSIQDTLDGRVEVVGKKYSLTDFRMTGDGNGCTIAEMFIPVTPYSIATLPMTKAGDFGPFSIDIDGDGKKDLEWSLLYPLFPEKQQELQAVIADMMAQKQ